MKDSYSKNMDVKVEPESKRSDPFASSPESSSAITPSFRHPSEMVMDSLRRFLRHGGSSPDDDTYTKNLTAGISRYCGLPENHIGIFPDNCQAVHEIIKAFTVPGNSILVCRPVVDDIFSADIREDISIQYHDNVNPFATDPEGIVKMVTRKTGLIYLANPNRCTGTIYGIDEIEAIIEQTTNVKIILDETYYEYYGTSLAGLISQYDNIIVIRSFSAAFGLVDLPCSYILASPENIVTIKRINSKCKTSTISMVAAAAVLGDYDYLKRHVSTVKENMTYLATRLRGMGITVRITPTDFILADVAQPEQVISRLHEAGIDVRSLNNDDRLRSYIAIRVFDDARSAAIIDAFKSMPAQFYLQKQVGKKLVLHRGTGHERAPAESRKM